MMMWSQRFNRKCEPLDCFSVEYMAPGEETPVTPVVTSTSGSRAHLDFLCEDMGVVIGGVWGEGRG